MNPFLGTWVANLEISRGHANHQFQSASLIFEVNGDVVTMIYAGVNMAGKPESVTQVFHGDGNERAVSPQAPGVVAVTKWIGPSSTFQPPGVLRLVRKPWLDKTLGTWRPAQFRRRHLRHIRDLSLSGGQGARGGPLSREPWDNQSGSAWMSWWIHPRKFDAFYALARRLGVVAPWPPTDMPWNVRECHIRHPDGHMIRVGARLDDEILNASELRD